MSSHKKRCEAFTARATSQPYTHIQRLKIVTTVTPGLGNVHTNFDLPAPFCFRLSSKYEDRHVVGQRRWLLGLLGQSHNNDQVKFAHLTAQQKW